jgi:hypothetical protein
MLNSPPNIQKDGAAQCDPAKIQRNKKAALMFLRIHAAAKSEPSIDTSCIFRQDVLCCTSHQCRLCHELFILVTLMNNIGFTLFPFSYVSEYAMLTK